MGFPIDCGSFATHEQTTNQISLTQNPGPAGATQRVLNLCRLGSAASGRMSARFPEGPAKMSVAELRPIDLPAPTQPASESTTAPAAGLWPATPELAVVIPTLNERDNVPLIVECLNRALTGIC